MRLIRKYKEKKFIIFLLILFVFFILTIIANSSIKIVAQNLKIKYFEIWNKYTLLNFYNELNKDALKSYNFYYIVTYDSRGRVLKFEYIVNSNIEFLGEVAFFEDNHATITLKKLETQLMNSQPVLVPYAMYEIFLNSGQITSYILYKVSPNLEKPVKIGDARFIYKEDMVIIENLFNDKLIMRIEINCDQSNIFEMKFFNDKNLLVEVRIFENNRLVKRIIYKYDSSGKLIQIITYDASGQIISTENK